MGNDLTTASELTTGSVLSRTCSTLFRNPTVFFGICFIAQIPNFLLVYYFQSTSSDVKISASVVVIALISGVITMLAQGALSYAVYQTLLGKTATIGESISRCLPQLGTSWIVKSSATGIGSSAVGKKHLPRSFVTEAFPGSVV